MLRFVVLVLMAVLPFGSTQVTLPGGITLPPLPGTLPPIPKCVQTVACPFNEVYDCCGNCRPNPSCLVNAQVQLCMQCMPRCICKPGFVRKVPNGPCVQASTCLLNLFSSGK